SFPTRRSSDLFQARPIGLVRGEAVERDQSPGDVVGSLMWQEVANEVAAAARDDAPPVRCVLFEVFQLERIDLVADEAGNRHGPQYRRWRTGTLRLTSKYGCR